MSTVDPSNLSEEQLRALYEEQMQQIRVEDVLMNSLVELINQGMRRTGLAEGSAADALGGQRDRDPEQVRLAIEAVRALMPLAETIVAPEQLKPFRDAVSQLQFAYVQIGGAAAGPPTSPPVAAEPAAPAAQPAPGGPPRPGTGPASEPAPGEAPAAEPGGPGPAQRSGRLWIPGQ